MEQEELLSKKYAESMKEAFDAGGLSKLKDHLNSEKEKWKQIPLNIAVTGNSGVGKSCFINAIRNVKRGDDLFADEGIVETTKKPTSYKHPHHPNFILWDLPGIETPSFPREKYLKKVEFEKYDFFIILCSQRFTQNDAWLVNAITKVNKRFFFVRTQIDIDFHKRDDLKEDEVLEMIRGDCFKELDSFENKKKLVFMINNKKPRTFDFDKLTTAMIEQISTEKREALALSLTILTDGVINAKKKALQRRIFLVAMESAAGAAVPLPGVGAAVDYAIIFGEVKEYAKQFGLDDQTMAENAKTLGTTVDSLKQRLDLNSLIIYQSVKGVSGLLSGIALNQGKTNLIKLALPFVGSMIAATASYLVCTKCLTQILDSMSNEALKLNKEMVRLLATNISSNL